MNRETTHSNRSTADNRNPEKVIADAKPKKFAGMGYALLFPLLFDMIIPLAGYYGLRFLGVRAFMALIFGALPTIIFQIHQIIKHRKADFLALFILGIIVFSVAISFVTGSARFMLAKSGWFTGVIGFCFLGSLFLKRPFAFTIAKNLLERIIRSEPHFDMLWKSESAFRRVWNVLTVIWGIGMLINAVILIYMAYALPVDSVPFLASVLHGGTFLILQIFTNIHLSHQGIWKLIFNKKAAEEYK